MKVITATQFRALLDQSSRRPEWQRAIPIVAPIVAQVRRQGDQALRRLTLKLDKVSLKSLEVTDRERKAAHSAVPEELVAAISHALRQVRSFARRQLRPLKSFTQRTPYGTIGQRVIPLDRVGVYVPGGRYPLPSSAIMGIVPAVVAGVKEVLVVSPRIQPATIVAADLAGAHRIFPIGGAQAIAALAYGTETIPAVDKIAGPGNRYVTAAKYLVARDCGIDMLAGPSEVTIIADESARPDWLAVELMAQAEHDPDARAYCLTPSRRLAHQVAATLSQMSHAHSDQATIRRALNHSAIVVAEDISQCLDLAERIAPEHLALHIRRPHRLCTRLKNYGALFLNARTAVAFGDYITGSNHILPTGRAARYRAGLSPLDFVKCAVNQSVSRLGAQALAPNALALAQAEGLYAHAESIRCRRPAD